MLHSIHARELHILWLQNEEIESDVLRAMVKGRAWIHTPRLVEVAFQLGLLGLDLHHCSGALRLWLDCGGASGVGWGSEWRSKAGLVLEGGALRLFAGLHSSHV